MERYQRGNLPYLTEDSIVEFPTGALGSMPTPSQKVIQTPLKDESETSFSQPETFASNLNKLPSQGFMDMKRKQQLQ